MTIQRRPSKQWPKNKNKTWEWGVLKRTLPLRNELGNLKPRMHLPNPRSK